MRKILTAVLLSAAVCRADSPPPPPPVILSIQNAASGAGASVSGLAPGELFTVALLTQLFGLSPASGGTATPSIEVQPAGGQPVTVPILGSSVYGLNARLPDSFPLGAAEITAVEEGVASDPVRIQIRRASFGIFRRWNSSPGPALAQNVAADKTAALNTMTNPAQPGGIVTLWGTGLGNATGEEISISVGNAMASALSAGPVADSPGMDQITFQLPASLSQTGCYVPVSVAGVGWMSNEVTVAIANGPGACNHPLGLTADVLARLDAGDAIPFATGGVFSDATVAPFSGVLLEEGASMDFHRAAAAEIDALSAPLQQAASASCAANASAAAASVGPLGFTAGLDAGATFTLTDPSGAMLLLSSGSGLSLPSQFVSVDALPSAFAPGMWQAQAPGGIDVDSLTFNFAIPAAMHITNTAELKTLDPGKDLIVTWDGGVAPDGFDAVISLGALEYFFTEIGGSLSETTAVTGVSCRVPASQGQVTIPAAMVAQVAAGSSLSPALEMEVTGSAGSPVVFPFTVRNAGPAVGYFTYSRREFLQFLESR